MEAKAETSKHMGRERTNSSWETVGTGQLRWEGECENVTSPFVIVSVTGWGIAGERDNGPPQETGRLQLWEKNQHAYFQGYQHDQRPSGILKLHCWKIRRHETRNFRGVLARDVRGPLKVG